MLHLITVFGQWKTDNVGWDFVLDPSKKRNVFFVEEDIWNMSIFSAWFVKITILVR